MISKPSKLLKLEGIRGAAALYVVLHHTISHDLEFLGINFGLLLKFGQEAVILFFLISGFVIHYSFSLSQDRSVSSYFFKRATRIYIPLLAVFLVSYLTTSQAAGEFLNPNLPGLIANIFMLQDWPQAYPHVLVEPYMGNGPLWSLSYEWWFYMLYFPIVTSSLNGQRMHFFVFGTAFLAAVAYVFYPVFILRIIMYSAIWWSGVYLASRYLKGDHLHWGAVKLPLITLGSIALILMLNVIHHVSTTETEHLTDYLIGFHPFNELRHFSFAALAISIGFVWRQSNWLFFNYVLKPFAFFAPISYTIYIVHDPIMRDSTFLSFISSPVLQWLVGLSLVLIVSYVIEIMLYQSIRKKLSNIFGFSARKRRTNSRQPH